MKKLFAVGALALLIGTARAADSFEQVYQAAREAYYAKQTTQAEALMKRAFTLAQTDEQKSDVLLRLATLATEGGHPVQSRAYWMQLAAMKSADDGDKATAQIAIAGTYLTEKNYDAGRRELETYRQMKGATPQGREMAQIFDIGSYLDQNNWPQTIALSQNLMDDQTASSDGRAFAGQMIGQVYVKQEKWEEAGAAFRAVLAMKDLSATRRAQAQNNLNSVHLKQNQPELVQSESRPLISDFLSRADAIEGKTEADGAQKRDLYGAALVLLPPGSLAALYAQEKLGQLDVDEKNYLKARQSLEAVLAAPTPPDLDAKDSERLQAVRQVAQFNLASSYDQENQTERAIEEYQKALNMPELNAFLRENARKALERLNKAPAPQG